MTPVSPTASPALSPTMKQKASLTTNQCVPSQPSKLNIRARYLMIGISQCVSLNILFGKRKWENVSTMKQIYSLPSVKGNMQIFSNAQWLHTNVKLESLLKLSISLDLQS